ncbi:DCD domain-containing protein [Heracleum sosnowskyi]|uniref:DCD domain-containing protein n=1 Tax=Heracleum sosnowskyi TaxID=360622 RepID=A0AAD8IC14_9APIA|nr:DCD domain-containing protein [Heracleum sosnowskyi]
MENNNTTSFYQFSDQLRVQTNNFQNLSLNDSIWSTSYGSKKPETRRNFDIRVGGGLNSNPTDSVSQTDNNPKTNFNGFNHSWKIESPQVGSQFGSNSNGSFNKGVYSKPSFNFNSVNGVNANVVGNLNGGFKGKMIDQEEGNFNFNMNINQQQQQQFHGKSVKKNKNKNNNSNESGGKIGGENKNGLEKRFKTLPPAESLPRNERVGGYIFVCNNDTMQENLKRQLFGLPPRYRDSVRAITPGLPLFLYNYSTHQLHGVFEAAGFGGTNIDPTAWEDKKNQGESRFPAQVRVVTRKVCEPLEEDSFRPILHHYDGPKFRLELNIPEAISLLDIFEETKA